MFRACQTPLSSEGLWCIGATGTAEGAPEDTWGRWWGARSESAGGLWCTA